MLGLGAVGVIFGKQLENVQSDVLDPVVRNDPTGLSNLLPAVDRFRYYNVAPSEPERTIAAYQPQSRRPRRSADDAELRRSAGHAADQPHQRLSVRDRLAGAQVHWSGVALPDLLDQVGVKSGATALEFTSFDGVYTESLTLAQGAAARHHRRADHARRARHPRPRRPGPALRRPDVRLQVVQVARRDHACEQSDAGLLGRRGL